MGSELVEGWRTPNLYGLLFVSGMFLGYFVIKPMFKKEGVSNESLDKLVWYMFFGTVVGARLGHVLFYGPYWDELDAQGVVLERGYFSHPGDIIKIWEGGLASHGAAVLILVMLFIYSRKVIQKPFLWILDRIAAPIALAGGFIRLGNLVNHEMVGEVTTVPWGFRFMHHDCSFPYNCPWEMIPVRHPAQLYESICYFITFGVLMFLFWKKDQWKNNGVVFGVFLIMVFGARFLVEFVKLGQTARDEYLAINTGQILSIPLVIAGLFLIWKAFKRTENQLS
jgi:phosphatidylglycerol:prolipoprotein diacylglycerol transferase